MERPGQGSNGHGRNEDAREKVDDLLTRIEALVKELRKAIDDDAGRQT